MIQQAPWRYSDAVNQVVVGRFYLSQGMDPKKVLDTVYNVVKKRQPSLSEVFLASGELALEKNDYALAAEAFQQAAKLDARRRGGLLRPGAGVCPQRFREGRGGAQDGAQVESESRQEPAA